MIPVWVQGKQEDVATLLDSASVRQKTYRLTRARLVAATPLRLLERPGHGLYSVDMGTGVTVNTLHSDEISRYAGLPRELYLLIFGMLGILQYRAVAQNADFKLEYLSHEKPYDCLYAPHLFVEDYALRLEDPYLCPSCRRFYREVLALREIHALEQVVSHAAALVKKAYPALGVVSAQAGRRPASITSTQLVTIP